MESAELTLGNILRKLNAIKRNVLALYGLVGIVNRAGLPQISEIVRYVEYELGHCESMRQGLAVDKHGQPWPWFTYPAIEYLIQFDFSSSHVFEFGSGNGSVFWANRAQRVYSVEDNTEWCERLRRQNLPNHILLLATSKEEYLSAITLPSCKYDVIVIDGKYRYECAKQAVEQLRPSGCIVLDNSDWYPKTSLFLRNSGLVQIDFKGIGPVNNYAWCTSLFLGIDFSVSTIEVAQPSHGCGSLRHTADPE